MSTLTLPSRQFCSFSRANGISTEISNLRRWYGVGEFPSSFFIESEKTKVKKLFLFDRIEKDGDGDIQTAHYFHPGDASIPQVTLFND